MTRSSPVRIKSKRRQVELFELSEEFTGDVGLEAAYRLTLSVPLAFLAFQECLGSLVSPHAVQGNDVDNDVDSVIEPPVAFIVDLYPGGLAELLLRGAQPA
jgi:hypothetical protein